MTPPMLTINGYVTNPSRRPPTITNSDIPNESARKIHMIPVSGESKMGVFRTKNNPVPHGPVKARGRVAGKLNIKFPE
jgi:hypothetical protein